MIVALAELFSYLIFNIIRIFFVFVFVFSFNAGEVVRSVFIYR